MSRLAVTGALLLVSACAALADGNAPSDHRLARLDAALATSSRVRLSTNRGTAVVSETRATPAGISYRNLLVSQRTDTLRSPGLVAWEEIRGVEAQGTTRSSGLTPGRLAIWGLVAGTGVGMVAMFAQGPIQAGGLGPYLFPPLGAGLGYGAGRFMQSRRGDEWRSVYP